MPMNRSLKVTVLAGLAVALAGVMVGCTELNVPRGTIMPGSAPASLTLRLEPESAGTVGVGAATDIQAVATVKDGIGNPVANGTIVRFAVSAATFVCTPIPGCAAPPTPPDVTAEGSVVTVRGEAVSNLTLTEGNCPVDLQITATTTGGLSATVTLKILGICL
jgi:hypothetical protein